MLLPSVFSAKEPVEGKKKRVAADFTFHPLTKMATTSEN